MPEQVTVSKIGLIVVENERGHRFQFQLSILRTPELRLVGVKWSEDESILQDTRDLDHARTIARDEAVSRGWMREEEAVV